MTVARGFAIVTGCTNGGIGGALARGYRAAGYTVIVTARSFGAMSELKGVDDKIMQLELDITSEDSIKAFVSEVQTITSGRLELLVNNAGVALSAPSIEVDIADVRRTFEVNVFGVMALTQALTPLLIKHANDPSGSRESRIVMISSAAGIAPLAFASHYGASKAALSQYTKGLKLELACLGVDAVDIIVGTINTRMFQGTSTGIKEGSLYASKAEELDVSLKNLKALVSPQDPKRFARAVVNKTVTGSWWNRGRARIWKGSGSSLTRLSDKTLPLNVLISFMRTRSGLNGRIQPQAIPATK